jgi:hypothetical protein
MRANDPGAALAALLADIENGGKDAASCKAKAR